MTMACMECGAGFEQVARKDRPKRFCDKACANRHTARNRATTKGWTLTSKGYVAMRAQGHPMADRTGYVMQHRLVVAEALGRDLLPSEVVHHINGVKDDNRLENLELLEKVTHDRLSGATPRYQIVCPYCDHEVPSLESARIAVRRRLGKA